MITLYTTSTCAYCKMVSKFLSLKGKEFTEVNIENDSAARELIERETGSTRVPVTKVNDQFITGWNPAQLGALI